MKVARVATGFGDIPGLTTLNVFTVGCSRRCAGCHNPTLWDKDNPAAFKIDGQGIMDKFDQGLHDAVCWLGGEPTEQANLVKVAGELKGKGIRQVLYTGLEPHEITSEVMELMDAVVAGPWRGLPGNGHKTVISGGWAGPFETLHSILNVNVNVNERAA